MTKSKEVARRKAIGRKRADNKRKKVLKRFKGAAAASKNKGRPVKWELDEAAFRALTTLAYSSSSELKEVSKATLNMVVCGLTPVEWYDHEQHKNVR